MKGSNKVKLLIGEVGTFKSGQVISNYLTIDFKCDATIDEAILCFLEWSKWMFLNSSICPIVSSLNLMDYVWNLVCICILYPV